MVARPTGLRRCWFASFENHSEPGSRCLRNRFRTNDRAHKGGCQEKITNVRISRRFSFTHLSSTHLPSTHLPHVAFSAIVGPDACSMSTLPADIARARTPPAAAPSAITRTSCVVNRPSLTRREILSDPARPRSKVEALNGGSPKRWKPQKEARDLQRPSPRPWRQPTGGDNHHGGNGTDHGGIIETTRPAVDAARAHIAHRFRGRRPAAPGAPPDVPAASGQVDRSFSTLAVPHPGPCSRRRDKAAGTGRRRSVRLRVR